MQTCSPPGTPAAPHTKLDAATDLNTGFNDFFGPDDGEEVAKEADKEAPSAAPEPPAAEPVVAIAPAPSPVDEPIVIPEPAKQQINAIVEAQYRREFIDPLKTEHEDLVRGIAKHLTPWQEGVDIERDFVGVLLKLGADEKEFTPQYVEDQIDAMRASNIQKEKMRGYARDYFARKRKCEEAEQNNWKETLRRGLEQDEIGARKVVVELDRAIREPEFSQFKQLRDVAAVGDSLAKAELEKIDAYWKPRAQGYANQGYNLGDAIRTAWRDALKELKIKSASNTPASPAPKKVEAAPEKPKAKKNYGSLEERLAKELADSFEQNLSKEQASISRGFYKGGHR